MKVKQIEITQEMIDSGIEVLFWNQAYDAEHSFVGPRDLVREVLEFSLRAGGVSIERRADS